MDRARQLAGLTVNDLWLAYFNLGGGLGPVEMDASLNGAMALPPGQYDVVAHALNEALADAGRAERVPYSFDENGNGKLAPPHADGGSPHADHDGGSR